MEVRRLPAPGQSAWPRRFLQTPPVLLAVLVEGRKRHKAGRKGDDKHKGHGHEVQVPAKGCQPLNVDEHVVVDNVEHARGEEASNVGAENGQLWKGGADEVQDHGLRATPCSRGSCAAVRLQVLPDR